MLVSGDGSPADRASQYNSRLARARAGNLSRRVSGSPQDAGSLMSGNGGSRSRKSGGSDDPDFMSAFDAAPTPPPPTSQSSSGGVGVMESSASGPAPERRPSESELASVPVKGFETLVPAGAGGAVHWAWNARARMIALVDSSQMLKVLNDEGHTVYRVQLPASATTIFVGWEPSGAVLAAVQKLGGAFLWFPSKPEAVQQWEGMQFASQARRRRRTPALFPSTPRARRNRPPTRPLPLPPPTTHHPFVSSQMLKSNVLARNTHFDVSFATWSSAGKLVLGLVDGNFAVWDLASNETFMSRKHFSGKLKGEVSCGAWGPNGENLAVGTTNQVPPPPLPRRPRRTPPRPRASHAARHFPSSADQDLAAARGGVVGGDGGEDPHPGQVGRPLRGPRVLEIRPPPRRPRRLVRLPAPVRVRGARGRQEGLVAAAAGRGAPEPGDRCVQGVHLAAERHRRRRDAPGLRLAPRA